MYKIQDNLFPTININSQHMELSVKRSLLVFLLLLTLLSPSTLSARVPTQQRSTKPTTPAPATAAAPARLPEANLISKVLPNGLEIIVLEDHSIPLVTIELAVRNGSCLLYTS